jgi:hypothetical protein
MARTTPLPNGSVTARCLVCDRPLPPGRSRTTCSDSCRQTLWRRRQQKPQPTPPPLPANQLANRTPHTAYECPLGQTRLLANSSGTTAIPSCAVPALAACAPAAMCPSPTKSLP